MDVCTVTNHNNARSCWELKDKGYDILAAAEFTCSFPDNPFWVHVLTYGFSPEEETRLKKFQRVFVWEIENIKRFNFLLFEELFMTTEKPDELDAVFARMCKKTEKVIEGSKKSLDSFVAKVQSDVGRRKIAGGENV